MSHFAEVEVDFDQKNEAELVAALEQQFGEGHVEVHEEGAALFGWHGDDRSKAPVKSQNYAPPCHIIIRRKFISSASNDIGYRRTEEGGYKAYISDYDESTYTVPRRGLVRQEYTLRTTEKALKAEGWTTKREAKENGVVRLVTVGRSWGAPSGGWGGL